MFINRVCNSDNTVCKFIHENGAETTIKTVSSCNNHFLDGNLVQDHTDKNKATVFISSSVGCPLGCKICYLTNKNIKYSALDFPIITNNTIDAIESFNIDKSKYTKLSLMGMGDVALLKKNELYPTVSTLMAYLHLKGYSGIDGVDIATSFPKKFVNKEFFTELESLHTLCNKESIKWNPVNSYVRSSQTKTNPGQRTKVRLFISLHHWDNLERKKILPSSDSVSNIIKKIEPLGMDIIFHYVLLDGVNTSDNDIDRLIELFEGKLKGHELRVLRYNECPNSEYTEPSDEVFLKCIKRLSESNILFKFQISAGSEIKAACGQFIGRN